MTIAWCTFDVLNILLGLSLSNAKVEIGSRIQLIECKIVIKIIPKSAPPYVTISTPLSPQLPVEGAVLDGFGDVFAGDGFNAGEIGDNNLGIALAMKGRLAEAIPDFQEAIRLKPAYASAHSNLGNAYAALHRLEEAGLVTVERHAGRQPNVTILDVRPSPDEA